MNWRLPLLHSRKEARQGIHEARKLRQEAELKRADEMETVVRPLREMRARNHLTEELVRIIRERG